MAKLVFGIAGGLLVALLAGWIWGASDAARARETAELRSKLLGARAATLDARVAIYSVNFGEASQHLENARGLLRRAEERFKSLARDDEGKQVQAALAATDDAQRMTGKLDQSSYSSRLEVTTDAWAFRTGRVQMDWTVELGFRVVP